MDHTTYVLENTGLSTGHRQVNAANGYYIQINNDYDAFVVRCCFTLGGYDLQR